MNTNVKIALIICVTALIITGMKIYFSPFQTCMRENSDAGWCTRANSGHIPFPQ